MHRRLHSLHLECQNRNVRYLRLKQIKGGFVKLQFSNYYWKAAGVKGCQEIHEKASHRLARLPSATGFWARWASRDCGFNPWASHEGGETHAQLAGFPLRPNHPGLVQVGKRRLSSLTMSSPGASLSAFRQQPCPLLLSCLTIFAPTSPVSAGGRWEAQAPRPLFVNTLHVRSSYLICMPLPAPEDV